METDFNIPEIEFEEPKEYFHVFLNVLQTRSFQKKDLNIF